jgi:branched-subunit amino acid transport protein AzlD
MSALGDLAPYAMLILVGFLPNDIWRILGIVLARGLDEDSEVIVFARATATAILTGVVGKLVIFAPGALAGVPIAVRLGATGLGVAAYLLARCSVLVGVVVATLAVIAGVLVFGGH